MRNQRARLRPRDAWQFVAALAELPAAEWISPGEDEHSFAYDAAASDVRRLIAQSSAGLTAWFLTDAVETAAWYSLCVNRRQQARIERTIAAARMAALAILVRYPLGEQRFRVLYAPFASLLPIDPSPDDGRSREVFMGSLCAAQRERANVQQTPRSTRP